MHTSPAGQWRAGRRIDFRRRICIHCRAKHAREELTKAPVVAQQQERQHHTQELDLWNSTVLCTVCTVHHQRGTQLECPSLCRRMNQVPEHRRHGLLDHNRNQDCWNLSSMVTGTKESPTEVARWCGRAESHHPQRATSRTAAPSGPTVAPTISRRTPHTRPSKQPRQTPPPPPAPTPPPPQAPWARHKLTASMGSSAEAVPTSSAEVVSHFFEFGEKCEKTTYPSSSSASKPRAGSREEEAELCPGRKS